MGLQTGYERLTEVWKALRKKGRKLYLNNTLPQWCSWPQHFTHTHPTMTHENVNMEPWTWILNHKCLKDTCAYLPLPNAGTETFVKWLISKKKYRYYSRGLTIMMRNNFCKLTNTYGFYFRPLSAHFYGRKEEVGVSYFRIFFLMF